MCRICGQKTCTRVVTVPPYGSGDKPETDKVSMFELGMKYFREDEPEHRTCPLCGGVGVIDGVKLRTCELCNGTGYKEK